MRGTVFASELPQQLLQYYMDAGHIPDSTIEALGRWSSADFLTYISRAGGSKFELVRLTKNKKIITMHTHIGKEFKDKIFFAQ